MHADDADDLPRVHVEVDVAEGLAGQAAHHEPGSAGLAGALSGKTQLTVFAPTDAAFAKVPAATLQMLLANKAKLRTVLLYHVVKGRVPAAKVTTMASATTLAKRSVTFTLQDGSVFVNDARVVKANVGARNGVIHVIDKVLIPSS